MPAPAAPPTAQSPPWSGGSPNVQQTPHPWSAAASPEQMAHLGSLRHSGQNHFCRLLVSHSGSLRNFPLGHLLYSHHLGWLHKMQRRSQTCSTGLVVFHPPSRDKDSLHGDGMLHSHRYRQTMMKISGKDNARIESNGDACISNRLSNNSCLLLTLPPDGLDSMHTDSSLRINGHHRTLVHHRRPRRPMLDKWESLILVPWTPRVITLNCMDVQCH